jgi:hypothetical protein
MICQLKNEIKRAALVIYLLSGLAMLLQMPALATQSVTFGWEPSTDTNVVGYNIYSGTASRVYTSKISVGSVTTATISGLVEGTTYYFAATTYDAINQESDFSDEISYTVPGMATNQLPTITGMLTTNTAIVGQNVTFSVTATGTGPLTYQWICGANNIVSATNAVLTLNNITTAQAGTYYVNVSNSVGSTNSPTANLSVYSTVAATLTPASPVNGQFGLNISGVTNCQYVVQASTNLVDWVPVQTNTAPFTFMDANASQFSQRFYRVCLPTYLLVNSFSDVTNGLVVDYPLALNGNDVWAGNNLTLFGSPAFSSGAINWNGAVPTYGYNPPQQWPQSGLTVSAWINMTDPTATYTLASCYGNQSGSVKQSYMQFFTLSSGIQARIQQNIDSVYIGRKTSAILTSGWHFVAFTWSGGTTSSSLKIYFDGTQVDNADDQNGSFSGPYSGSDVPLFVGAQGSNGTGYGAKFYGSQKGVRMYNHALLGSEIVTLYTNGISGEVF